MKEDNTLEYDPKLWAQTKRSRRFGEYRWKRRSQSNGHTVRRTLYNYLPNAPLLRFKKYTRDANNDSGFYEKYKSNLSEPTEFEKILDIHMINNIEYSLNKKKRWEIINPNHTNDNNNYFEADDIVSISGGRKDQGLGGTRSQLYNKTDRVFLGYYNLNDNLSNIKQKDSLNINNTYVKDSFYQSIVQKENKNLRKSYFRQLVNSKPNNVTSSRLAIKNIIATSILKGCKLKNSLVYCYGKSSYWSPLSFDNDNDYVIIDLGWNYDIQAISTKGRPIGRKYDRNYNIIDDDTPHEYVKKYKVYIKLDDHALVDKSRRYYSFNNNNNNNTNNDNNSEWKYIGKFDGNDNPDDEVANILDNNTIARYIKIQPLSHANHGFYGKKSMRIGVYGNRTNSNINNKNKKNNKNNHNINNGDNDDDNDNDDNNSDNNSDNNNNNNNNNNNDKQLTNKSIPATIISLFYDTNGIQKSKKYWGCRKCDGIASCSCGNCRAEVYEKRRINQRKRVEIMKRIKFGY